MTIFIFIFKKESTVKFHVVGLKCANCGAYNTCRTKGPSSCIPPTLAPTTALPQTNVLSITLASAAESTSSSSTNSTTSETSTDVCEDVHYSNENHEA